LDFCRQSCVVVFLVDGGPLIWKFREEKAGEIFVAGKLSKLAEKRPPHQQQEKKKKRERRSFTGKRSARRRRR